MVYQDIGPLEPPKEPSLWRSEACYSLSWKVHEHWHQIAADCVEKPSTIPASPFNMGMHPWYGVILVLNGRASFHDQHGHKHVLKPGVVFQRIPGQKHAIEIESDCLWREIYITMRVRTFEHLFGLGLIHDCPVYYIRRPEIVLNLFRDVLQLMDNAHSARVPSVLAAIQQLLIGIHENAERDWDPDPYRHEIAEACEILDCNLNEDIDIESIADNIGMAYETFRKAFKDRIGIAPGAYRVRKRIERSCVLLRTTTLPVNVIAEKLGYSDGFSYSAQFKKIIGTAPSIYRQGTP